VKIYKEGDTRQFLCSTCTRVTKLVYRKRDVKGKSILLGVCTSCDNVGSIPAMSLDDYIEANNED